MDCAAAETMSRNAADFQVGELRKNIPGGLLKTQASQ
jgi:hypothetical protein